ESCGITPDARCTIRAYFDGHGMHGWMGQHPLDGDRARARADIPQQLPAQWRERGQRNGADLALGDLAVMLVERIVKPRAVGDNASIWRGLDIDGDRVQRGDVR